MCSGVRFHGRRRRRKVGGGRAAVARRCAWRACAASPSSVGIFVAVVLAVCPATSSGPTFYGARRRMLLGEPGIRLPQLWVCRLASPAATFTSRYTRHRGLLHHHRPRRWQCGSFVWRSLRPAPVRLPANSTTRWPSLDRVAILPGSSWRSATRAARWPARRSFTAWVTSAARVPSTNAPRPRSTTKSSIAWAGTEVPRISDLKSRDRQAMWDWETNRRNMSHAPRQLRFVPLPSRK